jgi:hypothetical protein
MKIDLESGQQNEPKNGERNPEEIAKFYVNLIHDLKTGKLDCSSVDLNLHKPNLSFDEILEKMEKINDQICEYLQYPKIPIVQHLKYFVEKKKAFNDQKYDRLFNIESKGNGSKDAKIGSKLLDYSVKEKMVGFCSRNGNLKWDDLKITDFFNSIKTANSN